MRSGVSQLEAGAGERLAAGLESMALALDDGQRGRLLQYLDLLVRWNSVYNLTSVRDPNDMLGLHLLDSLSIVPLICELAPGPVLDVGSGAGLPAIPLAIAMPQRPVESVDAVAKKISFQRQVKAQLGLGNLTPRHARVEALTLVEMPAAIVSRAFAELGKMLAAVDRLAGPATRVIAMKAAEPRAELDRLPPGWCHLRTDLLEVPFIGADRCAVILQRTC